MPAEVTGDQPEPRHNQPRNSEQNTNPTTELTTYIDRQLLAPLKERVAKFTQLRARGNRPAQRFNEEAYSEGEYLPHEIARFEGMKQNVQQGNFSGIAIELQARRVEPEARIAELRPQLHPRGEMDQDDKYFALKEEILAGEKIQEKVKGVLDESERAWIVQSIEYRKDKQGETTRGRLMNDINREQHTLDEITHLQQRISQPPQP